MPFQNALAALAKRGLLPTTANSAQLAGLPAALRDEAFFSSKVTDARVLQAAYDCVAAILQPEGRAAGESMDTARAREEIRRLLKSIGYMPEDGKAGTIEDLSSEARLNLIIDHNVAADRGRGAWMETQDDDVLDMWPCQEFYRAEERMRPRNWRARWIAAGGSIYAGRMIARKDDPVWIGINRFGVPWMPADYNSGMDVRDVDRDEAVSLGVIAADDAVKTQQAPDLQMSVPVANMAPFLAKEVAAVMGPRVSLVDGILTFLGSLA